MASFLLPYPRIVDAMTLEGLHARLWRRRIEVPLFCLDGRLILRISAQAYNEPSDYFGLEEALAGGGFFA